MASASFLLQDEVVVCTAMPRRIAPNNDFEIFMASIFNVNNDLYLIRRTKQSDS